MSLLDSNHTNTFLGGIIFGYFFRPEIKGIEKNEEQLIDKKLSNIIQNE